MKRVYCRTLKKLLASYGKLRQVLGDVFAGLGTFLEW
jgi:hypothetical protein